MKVDGFDINVGVKGVLVEENRATCAMRHVEATREKLVVNIFGRLLQGNDMPRSCNLLFEGIFFSPTRSRVPVVVGGSFSARVPRSSAEVRRVFIHDIKEAEGVGQQEQKEDQRDDEEGDEVNGEVEEIRSNAHSAHQT